jgi:hypothetical protein
MENSVFEACDAPDDTLVNYILFGTLTVTQAAFILDAAGYSSGAKGCSASFNFEFPQITSTPTLFPAQSARPTITIAPFIPIPTFFPTQPIIIPPPIGPPIGLVDPIFVPIIPIVYDPGYQYPYPQVPFPGQYPDMKGYYPGPKGKSKGKSKGKGGKGKRRNFRT